MSLPVAILQDPDQRSISLFFFFLKEIMTRQILNQSNHAIFPTNSAWIGLHVHFIGLYPLEHKRKSLNFTDRVHMISG
jgi:hypothetical protein